MVVAVGAAVRTRQLDPVTLDLVDRAEVGLTSRFVRQNTL